jgi:hypothetical protein
MLNSGKKNILTLVLSEKKILNETKNHTLYSLFHRRWWRGVLETTLCEKVCQLFATGRRSSPGTPDFLNQ